MTAELHLAEDALALHLFFSTLRAWSTLLSRTKTCTRRSSSIQRLIVSAFQEGPGVPGVARTYLKIAGPSRSAINVG